MIIAFLWPTWSRQITSVDSQFRQSSKDRSIRHKKLLFLKYVYGQEILMHKSPISIILSLKADVNGAKLRNLCLNFKAPWIRIWSLWLKCHKEHMDWLVYYVGVKKSIWEKTLFRTTCRFAIKLIGR